MDDDYRDIVEHLTYLHAVYNIKRKRIKFLQLATVDIAIRYLLENFYKMWDTTSGDFIFKDYHENTKRIYIVKGLLGSCDDIDTIMSGNKAIITLDKLRLYQYLFHHIANTRSLHYLYNLFYGEEHISIEKLVKEQLLYLEQYLQIFKKFDDARQLHELVFSEFDVHNMLLVIQNCNRIRDNLIYDITLYKRFIRDFTKLYREELNLTILGYGEISTVMQITHASKSPSFVTMEMPKSDWVWKRMPPIDTFDDVIALKRIYHEYREILTKQIGIKVPEQKFHYFKSDGLYTVYAGQKKVNPIMVGNNLVKRLDEKNAVTLFTKILDELKKWHMFNKSNTSLKVGIDGQISNWVCVSVDGNLNYIGENDTLLYIDTSTPLYRINGVEQLNAELFLKNTPSFLRAIIRAFFLQEVLDRYYDLRSVVMDCIANLYKEKREDLIPAFVKLANHFFSTVDNSILPLTLQEIAKYYKNDAFIWRLFQFARRVDKFITEAILRKKYMYRLPEKIDR